MPEALQGAGRHTAGQVFSEELRQADPETLERLRRLGYLE